MWYNHEVSAGGGLGEMDEFSLHGGCEVVKGEKWIVNFWVRVTEAMLRGVW